MEVFWPAAIIGVITISLSLFVLKSANWLLPKMARASRATQSDRMADTITVRGGKVGAYFGLALGTIMIILSVAATPLGLEW